MTKIFIFQDLLYVVPFVAKILESCIDSKVGAALMFVSHLFASNVPCLILAVISLDIIIFLL